MKKSMLRKVLTMLLIAVSSMQASAQFEKYTSYLNTSLTGLGLSYSKDSRFKMGVQATGGYFVEDCWMVYGRFGFEHQGARGVMKNRNDLQIGVGGRYYIEQNGIFLGVGLAYQHATNVTFSQHESIIGGTTGPVEIRTVHNYYGNRFEARYGFLFLTLRQALEIQAKLRCIHFVTSELNINLVYGSGVSLT